MQDVLPSICIHLKARRKCVWTIASAQISLGLWCYLTYMTALCTVKNFLLLAAGTPLAVSSYVLLTLPSSWRITIEVILATLSITTGWQATTIVPATARPRECQNGRCYGLP